MMPLNPDTANTAPVCMSVRRPRDFTDPHRLAEKIVVPSQIELLRPQKQSTKGLFGQDKSFKKAVKNNGQLRKKE